MLGTSYNYYCDCDCGSVDLFGEYLVCSDGFAVLIEGQGVLARLLGYSIQ